VSLCVFITKRSVPRYKLPLCSHLRYAASFVFKAQGSLSTPSFTAAFAINNNKI